MDDYTTDTKMFIKQSPIGEGVERKCYEHPEDRSKATKISSKKQNRQTKREVRYYHQLERRNFSGFTHIPKYHGLVETNHGRGFVVDLIRDDNGEVSKSLKWYLDNGWSIDRFCCHLEDLRSFFINHLIIFNYDITAGNILVQISGGKIYRLVLIDGIGDVVLIKILNYIPSMLVNKLKRRWNRFEISLNRYLVESGHNLCC